MSLQGSLILPCLAAIIGALLLQDWAKQPVTPDSTFQQYMREAQFADEETWITAIAEVSQDQHANPLSAQFTSYSALTRFVQLSVGSIPRHATRLLAA